jgi:hypothetical protein
MLKDLRFKKNKIINDDFSFKKHIYQLLNTLFGYYKEYNKI